MNSSREEPLAELLADSLRVDSTALA
jgi:hypothetical protein